MSQFVFPSFPGGMNPPEPKPAKQLAREIVAEPIEAWRVWTIYRPQELTLTPQLAQQLARAHDEGRNPFAGLFAPRLKALAKQTVWERDNEAACGSFPFPGSHPAPEPRCSCGLWALKEQAHVWQTLAEYQAVGQLVYGKVLLWGRVIECERGYRAQHARPASITIVGGELKLVGQLAEHYQVPVNCEPMNDETARHRQRIEQEALPLWGMNQSAAKASPGVWTHQMFQQQMRALNRQKKWWQL